MADGDNPVVNERIEAVERRLAALQAEGIDTSSIDPLAIQARSCLVAGHALDAIALCDEAMLKAQRLATTGGVSRPARSPRTETITRNPATETQHPVIAEPAPTGHGEAITELRSGLSFIAASLEGRINDLRADMDRRFDQRLEAHQREEETKSIPRNIAVLTAAVQERFDQLRGDLTQHLNERLDAVQQQAETRSFHAPADVQAISSEVEQQLRPELGQLRTAIQELAARPIPQPIDPTALVAEVEGHLAPQLAQLQATVDQLAARPLPEVIDQAALVAGIEADLGHDIDKLRGMVDELAARPAPPTLDPADLVAEVTAQIAPSLQQIAASVEAFGARVPNRQELMEEVEQQLQPGLATLGEALDTVRTQVLDQVAELDQRLASTAASMPVLDQEQVIHDVEARLRPDLERIGAAIDGLAKDLDRRISALQERQSTPMAVDAAAIAATVGEELRADLAWQLERVAAEKGWVSMADIQSELASRGGPVAQQPASSGGFARLEAALVEFVHQSQSQQQQFLSILQQRAKHGTEAVSKDIARMLAGTAQFHGSQPLPSSAIFRAGEEPSEPSDQDNLDALSQTAQFRALDGALPAQALNEPESLPMTALHTAAGSALDASRSSSQAVAAPEAAPMDPPEEIADGPAPEPITHRATAEVVSDHGDTATINEVETAVQDLGGSGDDTGSHQAMELEPVTADVLAAAEAQASATLGSDRPFDTQQPTVQGEIASESDHGSRLISRERSEALTINMPLGPQTGSIVADPGDVSAIAIAASTDPSAAATLPDSAIHQAMVRVGPGDGSLEAGLRALISDQLLRLLAEQRDHARDALGIVDWPDDQTRVMRSIAEEVATQAVAAAQPAYQGGTAAVTGDVKSQVLRALEDPAVRQAVLAIVAVEALTNPGALGELTGIRAFIRREVQQAARQMLDAQRGDPSPLPAEVAAG